MSCRPRAWRFRDQIYYLNSIRYGTLKSFGMNLLCSKYDKDKYVFA